MRVKVISDGTQFPLGTRVENADTGEIIEGVKSVSFFHDAAGIPVLTLTMAGEAVAVEIECEAELYTPRSVPDDQIVDITAQEDLAPQFLEGGKKISVE